jgi:CRP/FNR family transcriptional regulator
MYLKFGLVKLYKEGANHKDQILSIAKPLDYVSLLTVFTNATYQYSIAAIEDSIICSFNAETIRNMVRNNAEFGLSILEKVGKTYDEIIRSNFALRTKQVRGRIAYILLNFADSIYKKNDFELPVSRREIAELINMTTENVIRILSEFRKDEIINIDGKRIQILDPVKLKKISDLG